MKGRRDRGERERRDRKGTLDHEDYQAKMDQWDPLDHEDLLGHQEQTVLPDCLDPEAQWDHRVLWDPEESRGEQDQRGIRATCPTTYTSPESLEGCARPC